MDVINLPLLSAKTSPMAAFRRLTQEGVSGLIAFDDAAFWYQDFEHIITGVREHSPALLDLKPRQPLLAPRTVDLVNAGIDLVNRADMMVGIERFLDQGGLMHLLLAVGQDYAVVATRHETLRSIAARVPSYCVCPEDDTHVWYGQSRPADGECPYHRPRRLKCTK